MRLKRVFVQGLFDTFDHNLSLNLEAGVTLMLGENGMGKTVMLRMIKAVFEQDFLYLLAIPFSQFRLEFEDGTSWRLEKKAQLKSGDQLVFSAQGSGQEAQSFTFPNKSFRSFYEEMQLFYNRGYFHRWENDEDTGPEAPSSLSWRKIYDLLKQDLRGRHPRLERLKSQFSQIEKSLPPWYLRKLDALNIHLIETQRLLRFASDSSIRSERNNQTFTSTVLALADELKQQIQAKIAQSAELATKLDQSFPMRLAQLDTDHQVESDQVIEERLASLKEKRNFLRRLGLYQGDQEDKLLQGGNAGFMKPVMQVYAEDNHQKLAVFDELAQKIDLFQRIINARFLYKEIKVDKVFGFSFFSTLNDKEIPLSALSSGEQHELVLFYQLLFDIQPHSLILINEPEISLHVSWQNHFIDDLKAVIKLNPIDILIATHSPSIVGSHWDLTVQLKGVDMEVSA
jgi:predicted ATP-binding protein involved in virulence